MLPNILMRNVAYANLKLPYIYRKYGMLIKYTYSQKMSKLSPATLQGLRRNFLTWKFS